MSVQLTREELVERLADISHRTWMRHMVEDKGADEASLSPKAGRHDHERAEEIVQELELLGVWPPPPR
jgi:hypothetical protein